MDTIMDAYLPTTNSSAIEQSAIVTLDSNGTIVRFNSIARKLVGLTSRTETQVDFTDLIDQHDKQTVKRVLQELEEVDQIQPFYLRMKDYPDQLFFIKAVPISNGFTREILFIMNPCHQLEEDIRTAVTEDQFLLYYQPIYNMIGNKITGFEALVRWHHPQIGIIPPSKFIPLLEANGQIVEVGNRIFYQACKQLKQWHIAGYTDLTININLSVRQLLSGGLLDTITRTLQELKLDPSRIVVEITESLIMEGIRPYRNVVDQIQALGMKVSIDDFGTGYSSLSQLTKLNINSLKIDKSFLHQPDQGVKEMAVMKSIVSLAGYLDLHVIVEGVEKREQISFLLEQNCYLMQGFYFSKPLPVRKATQLLLDDQPNRLKGEEG